MKNIKSIRLFCFLWVAWILGAGCASSSKSPALPEAHSTATGFKLRDYKTEIWPNGLEILIIEDHSLPSVSFGLLIKDGSSQDPMARSGLAYVTGKTMARGTQSLTAPQIADQLGQLGSEFEQEVSDDFSWFQVGGLSNHQSNLLSIFSDIILHPRFDESEISRVKQETIAGIKQRPDHPEQFAREAFDSYLFGGHPYARPVVGLEADVKLLRRKDLLAEYQRLFQPNNAVLVVTGDYSADTIAKIKKIFGGWSKGPGVNKFYPRPPSIQGVNIRVVDKPDLTQSQIIMGHVGIKRNDPDYLTLKVANLILGGNFSSRLMDQVRINLGLTYGISSQFDAHLDSGGFAISTFTRNQTVGQTILETMKVYLKFVDGGVTGQEVEAAKNYLMGTFPRAIETPERLGMNLTLLRLYGISDDYLKNFIDDVSRITAVQVNDVIKKHFDPKDLKILVLTKGVETLDQIRPIGLVEVKKFDKVF